MSGSVADRVVAAANAYARATPEQIAEAFDSVVGYALNWSDCSPDSSDARILEVASDLTDDKLLIVEGAATWGVCVGHYREAWRRHEDRSKPARPMTYADVVAALKALPRAAGKWRERVNAYGFEDWLRDRVSVDGETFEGCCAHIVAAIEDELPWIAIVTTRMFGDDQEESFATLVEAKSWCDAQLRAAGYVLEEGE